MTEYIEWPNSNNKQYSPNLYILHIPTLERVLGSKQSDFYIDDPTRNYYSGWRNHFIRHFNFWEQNRHQKLYYESTMRRCSCERWPNETTFKKIDPSGTENINLIRSFCF